MTPSHTPLFVTIVLDGAGIGSAPDAADYGDEGAHTLGHVLAHSSPALPNLQSAGLGCIAELPGLAATADPLASWGRMQERSVGKDSTTGHWELAGVTLERPFPTYPVGFPADVLERFMEEAGIDGILGNVAASGTEIVDRLGDEHVATGRPIVYTSADSVFQVAAHTDRVPLHMLYQWCEIARNNVCVGEHAVGRVIARPFSGPRGGYLRLSDKRRDFALVPPDSALPSMLQDAGVHTVSVGKVSDLFAGVGFQEKLKTGRNAVGIDTLVRRIAAWEGAPTFIWANLIDFDQEFGHRNDPSGFAGALEEFDQALPDIRAALPTGAALLITADHGNDPTFPGTDHTREFVPILYFDDADPRDLGLRSCFADHAATVAAWFGVKAEVGVPPGVGVPF